MRRHALRAGESSATRAPGIALFLGRGMTSWVRACQGWEVAVSSQERPVAPQLNGATLLPGLRGDVAAALTDMVLSNHKEAAS